MIYKKIANCLLLILLGGCQTNNFTDFYNSEEVDKTEYVPLKHNENITIIETGELYNRLNEYIKNGYVILGT